MKRCCIAIAIVIVLQNIFCICCSAMTPPPPALNFESIKQLQQFLQDPQLFKEQFGTGSAEVYEELAQQLKNVGYIPTVDFKKSGWCVSEKFSVQPCREWEDMFIKQNIMNLDTGNSYTLYFCCIHPNYAKAYASGLYEYEAQRFTPAGREKRTLYLWGKNQDVLIVSRANNVKEIVIQYDDHYLLRISGVASLENVTEDLQSWKIQDQPLSLVRFFQKYLFWEMFGTAFAVSGILVFVLIRKRKKRTRVGNPESSEVEEIRNPEPLASEDTE